MAEAAKLSTIQQKQQNKGLDTINPNKTHFESSERNSNTLLKRNNGSPTSINDGPYRVSSSKDSSAKMAEQTQSAKNGGAKKLPPPPAAQAQDPPNGNHPKAQNRRANRRARSNSDIPHAIFEHTPDFFQGGQYPYYGPPGAGVSPFVGGMYGSPHQMNPSVLGGGSGGALPLPFPVGRPRSQSHDNNDAEAMNRYNQQQAQQYQGPYGAGLPHANSFDQRRMYGRNDLPQNERQTLLPQQQRSHSAQLQQQHDQQRRKRRGHRKALSSSAAMPGHGGFWGPDAGGHGGLPQHPMSPGNYGSIGSMHQLPPNMHGASPMRHPNSAGSFSPRADVKKIFGDGSPTASPARGKFPQHSSARNVYSGNRINPYLQRSNLSWSSGQAPPNIAAALRATQSPGLRLPSPNSIGGEAAPVFTGMPSKENTRKKHFRQQSAQLFIQDVKGIQQPLACRNVAFLLLFVFHLLFVGVYLGEKFAKEALKHFDPIHNNNEVTIYRNNLIFVSLWSGAFAIGISTLLLGAMTIFARHFVQIALIVVITLSFIWGTLGVGLSPKTVVPVTGIIALGLAVAYTFIVWDRIPFSASNLVTALSGIRAFPGTVFVSIFMQAITLGWCVYFTIVSSGIYNAIQGGKIKISHRAAIVCYVLLGISFYWTYQVIQGCVKAITSGVISGWWHTPDTPGLVRQSCFKTLFYSMGSICFGSLFIGPVTILRTLSILVRPSAAEPSLMCLHECTHFFQTCISNAVDAMTRRFNAWSFTYIGMYNYGFLEAGEMATELFEKRGWTTIVSDDLVPNVLFLTSVVIGGVTGCFSHLISQSDDMALTSLEEQGIASFLLGIVIGLVLTSVVFSIVSSSVNTVLVCFADSPVDFERNHPELSTEMRQAWREVWPGALDVNDLRLLQANMSGDLEERSPLL